MKIYNKDEDSRRFYNSTAWRRLRNHYIQQEPLCKECERLGLIEPAIDVDHIEPIKERPDKALIYDNLQGLCKMHHTQKTVREMTAKRREKVKEVLSELDNLMNNLIDDND